MESGDELNIVGPVGYSYRLCPEESGHQKYLSNPLFNRGNQCWMED